MCGSRNSCRILMIFELFSTDCREKLKYQILSKVGYWKPSYTMRMDERTDRYDEASSHFSQFCECA